MEMNTDFESAWTWAAVIVRDKEGNTVVWQVNQPRGSVRTTVNYDRVYALQSDSPLWNMSPEIEVELILNGRLLQPQDDGFLRELDLRASQRTIRSINDRPLPDRREE